MDYAFQLVLEKIDKTRQQLKVASSLLTTADVSLLADEKAMAVLCLRCLRGHLKYLGNQLVE